MKYKCRMLLAKTESVFEFFNGRIGAVMEGGGPRILDFREAVSPDGVPMYALTVESGLFWYLYLKVHYAIHGTSDWFIRLR